MMSGSVQKYSDAIGYLDDLAKETNQPWFTTLRDITVLTGASVLDQATLDAVSAMFLGETDNVPAVTSKATVTSVPASVSSVDFLERMSEFSNFKLLCDTLQVDFNKPITLVFGTNGSGKSSLCESLRVLANPSKPSRPLANVRASSTGVPTFSFKFESDSAIQTWTPASGYGLHADKIKYFDTSIAAQNISAAVEPGRVITLTPFKLHVFETIKALTAQLREDLKDKQSSNAASLDQAFAELRSEFSEFNGKPLASISVSTMGVLAKEIASAEAFNQQKELADMVASAAALEKATSDEGLTLLKAEHRELDIIINSLQTLITSAKALWNINPVDKANGQVCPLCQRELEETQVRLFSQYYGLLTGQLETEITTLKGDISTATGHVETIISVNTEDWDKLSSLSPEMLLSAKAAANLVIVGCGVAVEPSGDAKSALATVAELVSTATELLKSKAQAIETSSKGRGEVLRQLETNDNGFRKNADALCIEFVSATEKKIEIKDNFYYKNLIEIPQAVSSVPVQDIIPDMSQLRDQIRDVIQSLCRVDSIDSWGNPDWDRTFTLNQKVDSDYMKVIFEGLKRDISNHIFEESVPADNIIALDDRVTNVVPIPMFVLENASHLYDDVKKKFPDYIPQFYSAATNIINQNYVAPNIESADDDLPF